MASNAAKKYILGGRTDVLHQKRGRANMLALPHF
jgi:hypothetical protein